MKLLIHHHVPVFTNEEGIWLQSFIGKWVEELAKHFDEIGLLLHSSSSKSTVQDTCLRKENIHLHDLGPKLGFRKSIERRKNLRAVLTMVDSEYDILLIRGITPRQYPVWKFCKIEKKAFLLVGSKVDAKPKMEFRNKGFITYILFYRRLWELNQILKTSQLFVNSPQTCKELKAHFGASDCRYLPTNTISSQEIDSSSKVKDNLINPSVLNILFVGRVVKDKGIEELLLASECISKENRVKLSIQIVGPITREYKEYLKSLTASDLSITFQGFVPYGSRLFSFYKEADVYVLPSYHEGFPHSIWEAAAMNTPVITCPVGGIPGIVNEQEVSFCQPRNVRSLAATIKEVIENRELAMMKNQRLRKKLREHTLEKIAERTFLALQQMVTTNQQVN